MDEKGKIKLKILGENIQNERIKKGITINELSLKTGIRKEYLRKIEKGEAYRINTSHFIKIANGLKVSPGLLVKNL